jgi:elongation factor 1-alpha
LNVREIAKTDVHRGDVAGTTANPPTVAKEFIGQIIVIYHPTAIAAGYTQFSTTTLDKSLADSLNSSRKLTPYWPSQRRTPQLPQNGDAAWVRMEPLHPISVETYLDFPELGRFAIRDMGTTVAAGVVKEVTKKGP